MSNRTTIAATLRTALLTAVTALLTVSCTTDAYEKGEGAYSQMLAELVEAHSASDGSITDVTTDGNEHYLLLSPFTDKWTNTPDTTYRAVLYYNKVKATDGSDRAQVVSLSQVLTASIHPLDYFKNGVKEDPVKMESLWMGKNGKYLNVSMMLMIGTTTGQDSKPRHVLGVAQDTLVTHADGRRTCHLRLYHDQGGMPEYYSQRSILSIPVTHLNADTIHITINTYEGSITRTVRPSQSELR